MSEVEDKKIEEAPEVVVPEEVEEIVGPAAPEEVVGPAGKGVAVEKGKGTRKTFGFKKGGLKLEKRDEFDERILDIARVTRVMAGGKRMRFRVCVAIGDHKGKIGVGVGKGADVTGAVKKAVNQARKAMIDVPLVKDTIPHEIYNKYCAAKIIFKPASAGKGVIAGGVVRVILELAGVKNITSKILGSKNKISNALCTIEALKSLKRVENNNKFEAKKEISKNK
ncbi:MAG TPA: 30S ribosomal protein S5 [Candidatus Methylomirabilis sp.]|nr:30S ribosomal protein S5 [Candidatus Methylomirabilis sp.]